ncbi:hypothetical protein VIGAN_03163700, partial [Vigna angularis var. angularis]
FSFLLTFHQCLFYVIFNLISALVPIEELENLLYECMLLTFNTEIEDGSIEQVAEQLFVIHEEYLLRQSS